jgi:hypothetical protein
MYAIVLMIAQACDPALAGLFTPPRPAVGRYEVCITSRPLETLVADGRRDGIHFGAIEALEALDAFGSGGTYNRFALASLYRGTRVRVAHGWRQTGDRFDSVTALSPYPDATLTRLNPGTMTITMILTVRRSSSGAGAPPPARTDADISPRIHLSSGRSGRRRSSRP